IAAYVGGRASSGRQSRVLPVVFGVGIALALRATGFITISSSATSTVSATLSYVIPAAAIVLFIVLNALGKSPRTPRWLSTASLALGHAIAPLLRRLSGRAAESGAR